LHVLIGAENCRAAGERVATDSLKNRGAIVHHVRHDVDVGVVPRDQFSVVPDFLGLLDGHRRSLKGQIQWRESEMHLLPPQFYRRKRGRTKAANYNQLITEAKKGKRYR